MTYEMMFEENKNLIYTAINTYVKCAGKYGINDYDDLFQIGSIGLWKAVQKYDESKGKFSSFAVPVIRNQLFNALRDAGQTGNTTSLDEGWEEEWTDVNTELAYDTIQDISDSVTMNEGLGILDSCAEKYGGIAGKGVQALKLKVLGYDCNDIAEMFGVEANTITAWMSRARKKLQKEPALLRLLDMA